jgi:AcrR family transcriptional regulator
MTAVKAHPYHHGDLRTALLEAVAEVVREGGLGQVSLREVARRVPVTHAAAAHHFGNKAGLLTAFATQGYSLLGASIMDSILAAHATDGPGMLEAVGRGYVRFALANRERFEAMFRVDLVNSADPAYIAASEAAYSMLTSTIQRCVREGFIPPGEAEPVAVSSWSLVHGLAVLWISGRLGERIADTEPDRLAARVSKLFVDAVVRQGRAR